MSNSSKSSYNAFKSVDELVAKPVVGSDGAASWQSFQQETSKHYSSGNVAPHLPLKKVDRLAGITSLQQERQREEEIRKQSGKSGESQGYTVFNKNNTAEEAAARKKRKQIESRTRPEEKAYYIFAETFEGHKFDYVFTTREGRTGYFWDGMDSVKKLHGEYVEDNETETRGGKEREEESKPKRKKKKKKQSASAQPPVILDDPTNPMEQVAEAIRRRNDALNAPPSALLGLKAGWEAATDSTGKTYYYNRATGERQWEKPTSTAGNVSVTTSVSSSCTAPLPKGWSVAKDKSTGKEYFYHSNGEVRWDRPT